MQQQLAHAKAEFAKTDGELNKVWTEAKKKLPQSQFDELKESQRYWLIFRNERAEVATTANQSENAKPQSAPEYFITAKRLTEDRIAWLRRLLEGKEEPLTGLWIDGQGGTVKIVEQKDRLLFDFNVVRTKAFNLGVLAGKAAWNQTIGWFSDKGLDPEKADETNIAFIQRDLRLEVISANADHYHGNRAYFDGDYFKAASLHPEEEAATVRAGELGKSSAEQ